ncbi:menaquinone biosynthetic enzyme MqnA/MqnD family protein [Alienimonas chondri]|uniref:Chorismate dehydratase n=1 Tax=Alienimonas chondri TaxID=2681879 RepID=A0ABX1VEM0_9PLAN|nr:menaquinone biosynthesis protein [Alienimonas chondri]NNJ25955.1 Chorismate dehydratase [Alienimonas chondri]
MTSPADDPTPGPRVGGVIYLNSRPLIEGLRADLAERGRLTLDHPSRLAEGLRAGAYDAALVPSVAALGTPGASILSDACVAARGPVRSVKLYFRVPPADVRSLALDEGSRTSAALARLLLAERFGIRPALQSLPVGPVPAPHAAADTVAQTDADAILLIGDRAMVDPVDDRTRRPFAAVWDLGETWNAWTGLPFVFAVWASRPDLDPRTAAELADRFSRSRDEGVADLDRIAASAGRPLGLTPDDAADYLRRNLHFTLGPAERAGLELFCELCERNELLPRGTRPSYAPARVRSPDNRPAPPQQPARAFAPDLLQVTR